MIPTSKAELNKPLATLSWNGQDFPLVPTSYSKNKFRVEVKAVRGPNQLMISGKGVDEQGLTVDNIQLIPFGSRANVLENGDFEENSISDKVDSQSLYKLSWWQGNHITVGWGSSYSDAWTNYDDQVLCLFAKEITNLYQYLIFTEDYAIGETETSNFKLSLDYAAEEGKPLAFTGAEIFWNK